MAQVFVVVLVVLGMVISLSRSQVLESVATLARFVLLRALIVGRRRLGVRSEGLARDLSSRCPRSWSGAEDRSEPTRGG